MHFKIAFAQPLLHLAFLFFRNLFRFFHLTSQLHPVIFYHFPVAPAACQISGGVFLSVFYPVGRRPPQTLFPALCLLRQKAEQLRPGESGLVALDWWNGNRSVLVDVDLTGVILGMTLLTKPEEIYRALIEATAYGTRTIIETFRNSGVPVNEFYAAGGIAEKDPMTMQIYADIINMPIKISGSSQGPALGSAIFGAVAAGKERGGYDSIFEAGNVMGKLKDTVYTPIPENVAVYDKLFAEYKLLHDYFGRGSNDVMKRLKAIKKEVVASK